MGVDVRRPGRRAAAADGRSAAVRHHRTTLPAWCVALTPPPTHLRCSPLNPSDAAAPHPCDGDNLGGEAEWVAGEAEWPLPAAMSSDDNHL